MAFSSHTIVIVITYNRYVTALPGASESEHVKDTHIGNYWFEYSSQNLSYAFSKLSYFFLNAVDDH